MYQLTGQFLATALAVSITSQLAAPARAELSDSAADVGDHHVDRYLSVARSFLDTMIAEGTDRYGSIHSPMWMDRTYTSFNLC